MRSLVSLLLIAGFLAAGTPVGYAATLDKAKLQEQRQAMQWTGPRLAKVPASARGDGKIGRVATLQRASRATAGRSAAIPPDNIRRARLAADLAAGDDSRERRTTVDNSWTTRSRPALPPLSERK
jgi:hypothetical protein